MLAFLLLARAVEADALGAWVLHLSTASFLHMCRRGIVKTGLVRFAAGADAPKRRRMVGAGWTLALAVTAAESLLVAAWGAWGPIPDGFALFVAWYPLLAWATLPLHLGTWLAEADDRFERVAFAALLTRGGLAAVAFVAVLTPGVWPIAAIARADVLLTAGASAGFVLLGWTDLRALRHTRWADLRTLFDFGKYSMGTLIGSHLLSSSDTYLIGLLLGPSAVAVYSVAQKAIRLVQVPLQALSATVFPQLSAHARTGDTDALRATLQQWTRRLTVGLLPVLVVLFIAADPVVRLLGGDAYAHAAPVLRWLLLYLALTPLDRALGMLLDSLGTPRFNLVKVGLMVAVNVAGNLVALLVWQSVAAVAAVTTLTLLAGVALGLRYARRSNVPLSLRGVAGVGA
jgi:O-antigen/teichoic acid export membrane protein